VAGALLLCCRGAPEVHEFTTRLHCGMTVEQARAIAESLQIAPLHSMPRRSVLYGTHQVGMARSPVWLEFENNELKWYRRGKQVGWTGMRVGVKHALCDRRVLASLVIQGERKWEHAEMSLDGRPIGTLPAVGPIVFREVDIPAGRHRLVISKPGLTSFAYEVTTDAAGEGVLRIEVP
jgi:hypothetical protein